MTSEENIYHKIMPIFCHIMLSKRRFKETVAGFGGGTGLIQGRIFSNLQRDGVGTDHIS